MERIFSCIGKIFILSILLWVVASFIQVNLFHLDLAEISRWNYFAQITGYFR